MNGSDPYRDQYAAKVRRTLSPEEHAELDAMSKARRRRLAKAELLLMVAGIAEELADISSRTIGVAEKYRLSDDEVAGICRRIGDELENRAMRAGFDETVVGELGEIVHDGVRPDVLRLYGR